MDGEVYRVIGKRLRSRRRMLSLTQSEVGAACGLTFQQIQKYEAGATAISIARLLTLADVLQVPPGELISNLEPKCQPHMLRQDALSAA